jgi:hypothetical protein
MDLYKKASKNMSNKKMVKVDLLHNKIVLYVVFAISLINLLIWVVGGDAVNVIVFLLVGFLTTFFSKNMIVVLLFALVVSNIVKFGIKIGQEGFDNNDAHADGFQDDDDGAEGMEEDNTDGFQDDDDGAEGLDGEVPPKNEKTTTNEEETPSKEGMQTLAYSFIEPENAGSSNVLEQQNKLLSNIAALSPYLMNAENESALRSQMKYSEYNKK